MRDTKIMKLYFCLVIGLILIHTWWSIEQDAMTMEVRGVRQTILSDIERIGSIIQSPEFKHQSKLFQINSGVPGENLTTTLRWKTANLLVTSFGPCWSKSSDTLR